MNLHVFIHYLTMPEAKTGIFAVINENLICIPLVRVLS